MLSHPLLRMTPIHEERSNPRIPLPIFHPPALPTPPGWHPPCPDGHQLRIRGVPATADACAAAVLVVGVTRPLGSLALQPNSDVHDHTCYCV